MAVATWRTLGCRPIRHTIARGRVEAKELGANSGVFLCSSSSSSPLEWWFECGRFLVLVSFYEFTQKNKFSHNLLRVCCNHVIIIFFFARSSVSSRRKNSNLNSLNTYKTRVCATIALALVVQRQHWAGQKSMQHLTLMRVIIETGGRFAAVFFKFNIGW